MNKNKMSKASANPNGPPLKRKSPEELIK